MKKWRIIYQGGFRMKECLSCCSRGWCSNQALSSHIMDKHCLRQIGHNLIVSSNPHSLSLSLSFYCERTQSCTRTHTQANSLTHMHTHAFNLLSSSSSNTHILLLTTSIRTFFNTPYFSKFHLHDHIRTHTLAFS